MNEVIYYERESGGSPVVEFLVELPEKHRSKALRQIDLLMEFGRDLREPFAKHIEGKEFRGLWELRIKFASDISRIFYFAPIGDKFVLLHGFVKKTDKTPVNELETAKRRMAEYKRRFENE